MVDALKDYEPDVKGIIPLLCIAAMAYNTPKFT